MMAAETIPFRSEGPQPLLRSIPPSDPYPVEALGPLRDVTKAAHDISQAPIAIAAQSALSVASLAVQGFADVETLGGSAPLSLFCLTIAQSGERKSASDKIVMAGVKSWERQSAVEHRADLASYRTEQTLWKADHDKVMNTLKGKNGNRTAAQADLDALGAEPSPPLSPNLTVSEPTLEGLHKLFQHGHPSLGLFSDEGGQFLGGHAMNSDNRLKTVAGLSDLWGGEPITRTRSGDGTITFYGRRLAVHLMAQPIAARPLMADPIASGQGFLARFLITEPQSAIGTRLKRGSSECSNVAIIAATQRLETILSTPCPTAESCPQELEPRQLPLSTKAKELLFQYYLVVEKEQGDGGQFEQIRSFASKSPEQAARIAGVLTLWDNLDAPDVSPEVMAKAITLAQFYLGEAKRLSEAALISAETEQAERLRIWINSKWPDRARGLDRSPDHIVPRDVVQYGPGPMREAKIARKHLKALEEFGWLHRLEAGFELDGSARQIAYKIVEVPHVV